MSVSAPRRKVAALAVAASGLAAVLSGFAPAASAATAPPSARTSSAGASSAASAWFVDPRTPAQRKAQVPVPRRPSTYQGRLKETRAAFRTRSGRLAVPLSTVLGHTLEKGHAVTVDGNSLYVPDTTTLSASATARIRKLAVALGNASTVRCEGYADYAGPTTHSAAIARTRAARVCDLLVATDHGLRATVVSYGATRPAVIGGTGPTRNLNRRVVVEVTGTRPTIPDAPQSPQVRVPGPPVLASVTGDAGSVHYSWTAPADDGGSPILGYEVSTGAGWASVAEPVGRPADDLRHGTVSDLAPGTTVDLRVRAVNAIGAGIPSEVGTTHVYGAPSAPTGLHVTGDDGAITATFGLPEHANGTPATSYDISYDGGAHWTRTPVSGTGPWTVVGEGFDNGTVYDVRVRWTNTWGTGPAASLDALVATVPDAPWIDAPELDGTTASFAVEAPASDGGASVTGYRITTDGGSTWAPLQLTETADGLSFELTDLELGREYDLRVRAVNARGDGATSNPRTFTLALVPSAPTGLVVVADDGEMRVTFGAPLHDNGAEVTSYDVSFDGGQSWWFDVALDGQAPWTFTMTGFVNGETYDVRVRASNRVGTGAEAALDDVLVAAAPDVPVVFGIEPADAAANLMFGAPSSDGGSAITSYQVSLDGGTWAALTVTPDVMFPHILRATISDLVNGQGYDVRIRAVNARGASQPSTEVRVTPSTVPEAPTNVVAFADGTTVAVGFDGASDGGSDIVRYEVRVDQGAWTAATVVNGAITLTDQQPGLHTYAVRAVNANGESPAGTSAEIEVAQPPAGAPTNVYVVGDGNNGTLQTYNLQWTPGNPNGATVTGWQARVDEGSWGTVANTFQFNGAVYGDIQVPCDGACGRTYTVIYVRGVLAGGGYTEIGETAPGPGIPG